MANVSARSKIAFVIKPKIQAAPKSVQMMMSKQDVAVSTADANKEQKKPWKLNKKKNINST